MHSSMTAIHELRISQREAPQTPRANLNARAGGFEISGGADEGQKKQMRRKQGFHGGGALHRAASFSIPEQSERLPDCPNAACFR